MKNDLPWFKHYNGARNHPKMKALRGKFGPTGYGRFWMLNEMISDAPGARLDLTRKINLLATAGELGLELPAFEEFIAFLSDPEIDLVNYTDGILTTDQTQEDYTVVEGARDRKRGLGKTSAEKRQNAAENPGNAAEKVNRGEERRGEENRIEEEEPRARETIEDPKSRELALYAYALEVAKERNVRIPVPYAKKLMTQADFVAEFEAKRSAPPPPPPRPPAPDPCPHCGSKTIQPTPGPGQAPECFCPKCRTSWTFDGDWREDREKLRSMAPVMTGDEFEDAG